MLAVISHDAGGAEIISSHIRRQKVDCLYSLEGPARRIFERKLGAIEFSSLEEVVRRSSAVLCGTSWQSSLEFDAIKLARYMGKHSVAFLDHWVNYRERFTRLGETFLPDEMWVTDEYAKRIAEIEFPDIQITQLQNSYLENMVYEVRGHEQDKTASHSGNILYVLEPIRQAWGASELAGEFQALDFFTMNLAALQLDGHASIKLRPHPSDAAGKYDQWIESQKGLKIALDVSPTLAESIAWADIVVGCQTYAMVVALAAGRRVISSIPPWAPACVLPHAGIFMHADLI